MSQNRPNLDPIRNLPPEIFKLVIGQCEPEKLKESALVSPDWYDSVSNTKQFIAAHECRYEIVDGSKYNDLDAVDHSKFSKLKVTSKRLINGNEGGPTSSGLIKMVHIEKMQKFSPYLTQLELNEMKIEGNRILLKFLKFIKDCPNLRSLNLESIKVITPPLTVDNPLLQKKIDHVRVLDSYSALEYLSGLEIDKVKIFGGEKCENSILATANFLNTIDVLNEIECDEGIFFTTNWNQLEPKFMWRKAHVSLRGDWLRVVNTIQGSMVTLRVNYRSIETFMAAADDGAELTVSLKQHWSDIFHEIMRLMSRNVNISKLTIYHRRHYNVLNEVSFGDYLPAVGVQHFIAKIDYRRSLPAFGVLLESLLEFCPNAKIVELNETDFEIPAETCSGVTENVKSLSIDSWAENADVGEYSPGVTHLKIGSVKASEWVNMQDVIANNMQLQKLHISKILCASSEMMDEMRNQLKQRLTHINQSLEIQLDEIINV